MNVKIVLINPENAGNIGAIARVMANFGCKDLILVNPKADYLCKEATDRSSHAINILKKAKVIKSDDMKEISNKIRKYGNHIIATTSKLGNDYNILRSIETIESASEKIMKSNSKIVIMFGRESSGLTNRELEIADFSVTISVDKKYPVLNLSHAVSVCLYELFKHSKNCNSILMPKQAQRTELNQLNRLVDASIDNLKFQRTTQKKTQKIVWKKLLSKICLSKREAYSLMGYFKKILGKR